MVCSQLLQISILGVGLDVCIVDIGRGSMLWILIFLLGRVMAEVIGLETKSNSMYWPIRVIMEWKLLRKELGRCFCLWRLDFGYVCCQKFP